MARDQLFFFRIIAALKLFVLILSVYVFALTVRPCHHVHMDGFDQHQEQADHGHDEEQEDFCSPFCICSCVNAIEIISVGFRLETAPLAVNKLRNSLVVEHLHSDFLPSFWQPPKI